VALRFPLHNRSEASLASLPPPTTGRCLNAAENHSIVEWFVLEGTLKIVQFQVPKMSSRAIALCGRRGNGWVCGTAGDGGDPCAGRDTSLHPFPCQTPCCSQTLLFLSLFLPPVTSRDGHVHTHTHTRSHLSGFQATREGCGPSA